MFSRYEAVLRIRGGLAFSTAGFVARLPMSMVGLGMVLLVSARTGSYGLAGAVTAVFVLVGSAAAPLQARVADRAGQGRVLWPLLAAQTVGYLLFLAAARPDPQAWQLFAAAALIGASQPQIGSMVRARWSAQTSGTGLGHTAYALESVLDEAVFVIGPVLVTVLATQVHPYAALVTTLLLGLSGGAALAVQRRTEPPVHVSHGPRPPLPVGDLAALMLGFVGLGVVFGAIDVVVVASADAAGSRGLAGAVIASFAGGSFLAGIVYGALHWTAPLRTRLLVTHGILALAVLPLPFLHGLLPVSVVVALAGLAVSPTLVTGFSLIEQVVPAARLTEGLSWVSTVLGAGVAAGATLAGHVVDTSGASAGFWVPVAGAVLAVLPAAVSRGRRTSLDRPRVLAGTASGS